MSNLVRMSVGEIGQVRKNISVLNIYIYFDMFHVILNSYRCIDVY